MSHAAASCYVVVAPGLEGLVAAELRALGIVPGAVEPGGVNFQATAPEIFRTNLHLRTASRILVRIAEFRATAFHELDRLARGVPWETFVEAGGAARLRVSCRKSRLYHSDGVAERVAGAITRRVKGVTIAGAPRDDDEEDVVAETAQLFAVRFHHDVCTISADASGALLHRRGYRQATAKAPIRETLAAALLLALEWDGGVPLVDPMCGAGTIAIEAALLARRIPPGLTRDFACEQWPAAPAKEFAALRDAARDRTLPAAPAPILASDRDAGAIDAARANAARAGVAGDVAFTQQPLSAATGRGGRGGRGVIVTNPPYGARVGERTALRSLYAQLGNVARAKFAGWTLAFIAADRVLEGQVKLPLAEVIRFKNGGIPVRLVRAEVPARD